MMIHVICPHSPNPKIDLNFIKIILSNKVYFRGTQSRMHCIFSMKEKLDSDPTM